MNEYNDVRIVNDDPLQDIRYTNDDIPVNEREVRTDNGGYSEFGKTGSSASDGSRFGRGYDITKMAATFAVVSVVAMAVVLDDTPFGELFSPVMGVISESFGISYSDSRYPGDCELILTEITDTEVMYSVSFSEDPGSDLRVTVTNLNTDRSSRLEYDPGDELGIITGTESGLRSGMKYTISVLVGDETVASRSFTTLEIYDEVPTFAFIGYKCHCAEDGRFYFRFSEIDRNGVWSDWAAVITYDDGSTVSCTFTDNVTDQQSIPMNLQISDKTARLTISCTQTNSDGTTQNVVQYNETVNI